MARVTRPTSCTKDGCLPTVHKISSAVKCDYAHTLVLRTLLSGGNLHFKQGTFILRLFLKTIKFRKEKQRGKQTARKREINKDK